MCPAIPSSMSREEGLREVGDETVDLRELHRIRQEHDAEESVLGSGAKARAVDAEDAGRTQQRQNVGFVRDTRRQLDLRHRVERRRRRDGVYTWNRVQLR